MEDDFRRKAIRKLLEHNILVSPEILDRIGSEGFIEIANDDNVLVLTKDTLDLAKAHQDINWSEVEKLKARSENTTLPKAYSKLRQALETPQETHEVQEAQKPEIHDDAPVQVLFNYTEKSRKRDFSDFVNYFNQRYNRLSAMLAQRQELQNVTSIKRVKGKTDRSTVSIIGIVSEKNITKNNNLILVLEDPSGSISVLVNKNKPELLEQAQDISLDEIIAVVGVPGENILFANNILWPEVPLTKELKKAAKPGYLAFISDIHVGSEKFLGSEFGKFIAWLKGETGSDRQREIAMNLKYLFIGGDLVDGVGVYPAQDKEQDIPDIYQQYEALYQLLRQIPERIKVIICPGNHDAVRISEPQPSLPEEFASKINAMPNVLSLSNPCYVNIDADAGFPGFVVLMYHGYSFDYFISNVGSIRKAGGYDRGDLVMKYLLQRRHLGPSHSSTRYIPDPEHDSLIIDPVPDFFLAGHLHKTAVANYRNATMIMGSCWQAKTPYQEKVGHHPEPGRVPIVNLQTRQVHILKFGQ